MDIWNAFIEHFNMLHVFIFLFVIVLSHYILIRLAIYIISWYFHKHHGIKVKVGFVKLQQLDDLAVQLPNGLTLAAENVYISSKLFSQKHKSLIGIGINGLRIQGKLTKLSKNENNVLQSSSVKNLAQFIRKLKSHQLLSLLSITVQNFSFNQLGISNENFKVDCLLNATIQDFNILLRNKNKNTVIKTCLSGASLKLLNHGSEETCLADLSLSLSCFVRLDQDDAIHAALNLDNFQIILYDGLPAFTSKVKTNNYYNTEKDKYQINNLNRDFVEILINQGFKSFVFGINNFSLQIMKDHGQKVLSTKLEKTQIELENSNGKDVEIKIVFKEFQSSSRHVILARINKISFFIQLEQESTFLQFINIFILSEIKGCAIDYNEIEINYWVNYLKSFKKDKNNDQKTLPNSIKNHNFVDKFLDQNPPYIKLNFSTELNNLEFRLHPSLSTVKMCIILDRCKLSNMVNPDPLLKEISCECLLESFCCYKSIRQKNEAFCIENFENIDYKEVPFYLNNIILKVHYTALTDLKINCVSNIIAINLDYLYTILDYFLINKIKKYDTNFEEISETTKSNMQIKVQINTNSLALFSDEIKANVFSLIYDHDSSKFSLTLSQLEIISFTPVLKNSNQTHKILELCEFKYLKNCDIKESFLTFNEEFYFQWNITFHIKVCNLVNKYKNLKIYLNSRKNVKRSESVKRKSIFNVIKVRLDGNIKIGALLSTEGNTVQFITPKLSFTYHHSSKFNCSSEIINIKFDDRDIFEIKQLSIQKLPEYESSLLIERNGFHNYKLESNKNICLNICIAQIEVKFPYQYNFANTFNEKLITIIKWVKIFHKKVPSLDENRENTQLINQDLMINIGRITLIVCDDPFEKRLHVNYCLLVDEYQEGLKRTECLSKKINEVQKVKNLTKEKIDELYTALELKQDMIYIERQQMIKKNPGYNLPSPLFTFYLENLKLIAMADSTLNEKAKLVYLIRNDLDKTSLIPEDPQFSTIWGRILNISFAKLECTLRDFKRSLVKAEQFSIKGLVIGAEQDANSRAKRSCFIDTSPNEEPIHILRSMTTLKFFHDVELDAENLTYTHGTCWESVLQQLNISFESIIKRSSDPSPALPWYDKMRFLFHGVLKFKSRKLAFAFHGSLNPYNKTEFIEIAFTDSILVWQIGKITVFGNLDLYVHTESKYDEKRIIHIPNAKLNIDLNWICLGNQYDHHSVMPCASDKVPEYSSNQVYDSYRAFRSQNLSVNISLESEQYNLDKDNIPSIIIYSSTLRWFEKQKFVISGFSRLARRGKLFNNTKPRKQPFSRIFKRIRLTICLHKLKISYFSSYSKQYGFEIIGGYLSHSGEHRLSFSPYKDGLKRRPRPVWDIVYMNSEVCNVEIWLHQRKSDAPLIELQNIEEENNEEKSLPVNFEDEFKKVTNRHYFLSFTRMCYHRESGNPNITVDSTNIDNSDNPIHSLVVHDLKGAWTKDNRDIAISLFNLLIKTEQLRRNLSTDALKGFKLDDKQLPHSGPSPNKSKYHQQNTSSPASTMNRGHAASMLQKLIEDNENNSNIVYTEDQESEISNEEPKLKGIAACLGEDVINKNWLIELVNSQVMLRGIETQGYIIVSAANTRILQKQHKPVWKERTLYSKTTWVGSVECMQYYATMDIVKNDDIVWLSIDNIQQKSTTTFSDLPDLVGSGHSAGGVVTAAVVNPNMNSNAEPSETSVELQRIISRCGCQFFYVNFAEDLNSDMEDVPPLPDDNDLLMMEPWDKEVVVDSFTFTHPELCISTNSQQFRMIMDIINNLLCYVEQHRKEAHEKLQRMRFRMFFSSLEEQKDPILKDQDLLRAEVRILIALERASYVIHREIAEEIKRNGKVSKESALKKDENETKIEACKNKIDKLNEELSMRISIFKEAQITEDKTKEREAASQESGYNSFISSVVRRIEICFKQATWRLTDQTGQLGLADMELSNFLYTKVAKNDDSVDHTLELGYIKVQNLLPSQAYKIVLQPTKPKANIPLDHHRALRIFCRESPPVGGISIKEHFEVNVIPITIEVTNAFVKEMLKFFFPEKYNVNYENEDKEELTGNTNERKKRKTKVVSKDGKLLQTGLIISSGSGISKEDVEEKMRQRALKNQNFVYIKISEVPIRVSYKGNKEKNFADIKDFSLILPTIEYHNQNWTWLDVLMAIKGESKRRLLPQAVKQKLLIKTNFFSSGSSSKQQDEQDDGVSKEHRSSAQEEEEHKARLLLGKLAVPVSSSALEKSSKFKGSGLSLFSKKH